MRESPREENPDILIPANSRGRAILGVEHKFRATAVLSCANRLPGRGPPNGPDPIHSKNDCTASTDPVVRSLELSLLLVGC